jgi:hypothetical protein
MKSPKAAIVATLFCLAGSVARAESLTFTSWFLGGTFGQSGQTPIDSSLLPPFDSSLGTLNRVTLSLNASADLLVSVHNSEPYELPFSGSLYWTLHLDSFSGFSAPLTIDAHADSVFSGVVDASPEGSIDVRSPFFNVTATTTGAATTTNTSGWQSADNPFGPERVNDFGTPDVMRLVCSRA